MINHTQGMDSWKFNTCVITITKLVIYYIIVVPGISVERVFFIVT